MTRRKKILTAAGVSVAVVLIVFVTVLAVYSAWQNKTVHITAYTVEHEDIPKAFDGKRIVHLTDLHNKDYGGELQELVAAQNPDIIVITGDWIGMMDEDLTPAKEQVRPLVDIAPVYFVPGNHERYSERWPQMQECLTACGVTVMENIALNWEQDGQAIQLIGVFDSEFGYHLHTKLAPLVQEEMFSLLLYHRPERFPQAAELGVDLLLCGHTHGGQIRLPWIGAIFAPDQGWFPKYDVGRFEMDGSTMLVGQGLGESVYFRILTPPEIVVVTLKTTT